MPSLGIEEDFFLLDALTGLLKAPSASANRELLVITVEGCTTQSEFWPASSRATASSFKSGPGPEHCALLPPTSLLPRNRCHFSVAK